MEIYLNIAEWGPNGEFGAEAAARHAFNKPARDLSAREAALLAAILPNPRPPQRRQARAGGAAAGRDLRGAGAPVRPGRGLYPAVNAVEIRV